MPWLNMRFACGLLLVLFHSAGALSAEPLVEVTSDALQIVSAPEDGLHVITAEGDELTVRDLFTLAPVAKLPSPERPRTAAAISGDGKFAAVGDGSGRCTVWQVADPPVAVAKFKHLSGITHLQLSHDGQQIAVVSKTGIVVRAVDGSRSWVLPIGPAQSIQLSADGRRISADGTLWDIASRRRLQPPQVRWADTYRRGAGERTPFVNGETDDTPDRKFELGEWLVTVKRHKLDGGDYSVVRICDAEPMRQRAVLLFDDEGWDKAAQQRAGIVDGRLVIVTWDVTTVRRWRMQFAAALAVGEQFAVAHPADGQWQGIARWNPRADPLAELMRLRNWRTPAPLEEPFAGHVNFSGSLLRDDDFEQLARIKGLKSLRLEGWQFQNASLAKLSALPALERLVLGSLCRVDHVGLASLGALPKLKVIEFEQAEVPYAWFTALGSCQKLRVVRTSCPVESASFPALLSLRQLEELPELGCCIRGENIDQLKHMASLRTLNLTGAQISDAQLESLSGLPQLESLSIQVDIDGQASLEALQEVGRIVTATTRLDALLPLTSPRFSAMPIPRSDRIERHSLAPVAKFSQLKRLRVTGNGMNDHDFQVIAGIPHLQQLDLTGCTSVSDAGLECFAALKELRTLKLAQTSVSANGVAKLKKALPKCTVTW